MENMMTDEDYQDAMNKAERIIGIMTEGKGVLGICDFENMWVAIKYAAMHHLDVMHDNGMLDLEDARTLCDGLKSTVLDFLVEKEQMEEELVACLD